MLVTLLTIYLVLGLHKCRKFMKKIQFERLQVYLVSKMISRRFFQRKRKKKYYRTEPYLFKGIPSLNKDFLFEYPGTASQTWLHLHFWARITFLLYILFINIKNYREGFLFLTSHTLVRLTNRHRSKLPLSKVTRHLQNKKFTSLWI